ncbi:MAG: Asp-tRNA(Asn)/Glu-tRNA(Gln) amidotransferase subunit GatA [Piscirickettsiaceae bacterium]|nr:Asp-tRNA(Asn)/Glu-tRNA(Gln) amidotransferase subunit GatA [Piscirickettsiaceae bacterium]
MNNYTLSELSKSLHNGNLSSVELTQYYLDLIKIHNGRLNAFITVNEENAMIQAQVADQRLQQGTAGILTGIPIAHKDIFCTKGVRTSCASKMLDKFIAPYDATIVEKINAAGMVTLGKTNMDEFAMGSSNETSFYGKVRNPWNTSHVPGGSSGGSAAAVAAGLTPIATGTDTGGSIRQPASLCNLTGLKPTYGRISRYGMIAFASSLDQAGPMAKNARDAAMLLNTMAGFDRRDSTSVNCNVPDYTANLDESIEGLTIGLPKEYFDDALDNDIATTIENAIKIYESIGAIIKEVALPNTKLAIPTYYIIAPAECSSNLSRMDGVRFGHRCEDPKDLTDLYERSRGEGFGEEVKRRIMIGTYALSAGYYDTYYLKAQQCRHLISNDFQQVFNDVNVIMCPTTPTTAFKFGEKMNDPVSMYLADIYTISANLAGLPSISIPANFLNNLPIGMQIIGNYFDESYLLNIANRYQQITAWHQKIPNTYG